PLLLPVAPLLLLLLAIAPPPVAPAALLPELPVSQDANTPSAAITAMRREDKTMPASCRYPAGYASAPAKACSLFACTRRRRSLRQPHECPASPRAAPFCD